MADSPASRFFSSRGKPAPSLSVTMRLVRTTGTSQEFTEAEAVFRFVSDRDKADADGSAAQAIGALTGKGVPVTEEMRAAYQQAHFLHAALRDKDNPAAVFFDSATECMLLLVDVERIRLLGAYQSWKESTFPDAIDPEKFKEAVEDFVNFTGSALLTKYGYDTTRRLLISWLLAPSMFPTPRS